MRTTKDTFSDGWSDLAQRGLEMNAERFSYYNDFKEVLRCKWGMIANYQGGQFWKQDEVTL